VQQSGHAVVGHDLLIDGHVQNARLLEVHGTVKGGVAVGHLIVHPGGRVVGNVQAGSADVFGYVKGDVTVKALISIGGSGEVTGNVRYGQLALAEGGLLSAEVRNIPPDIGGDFQIVVRRGRAVRVTTADVTAYDPDDTASDLVFTVSRWSHGHVALAGAPEQPVSTFTQSDLDSGSVLFVHDGVGLEGAGFDVVVADRAGATSGAPRTVAAAVIAG
jgi:cytoskeletal protein CcmA (bactofilin family)